MNNLVAAALPGMEHRCGYFADRMACHEAYLFLGYDDAAFCTAIEQGFRHFGNYFFRPACRLQGKWCGACLPVRVPVASFRPSKSQRRVLRRGEAIELRLGEPQCTSEKYEIYLKHNARLAALAHDNGESTYEGFASSFYDPARFTRECTYWLGGRLIGAGLIDLATRVCSSIYFFFDPEFEGYSPGILSMLRELVLAAERGIPYYYPGYAIAANRSMRYKLQLRPMEWYDGRNWQPLRDEAGQFKADVESLRAGPFGRLGAGG